MTIDFHGGSDNAEHSPKTGWRWTVAVLLFVAIAALCAVLTRSPKIERPTLLTAYPTVSVDAAPQLIQCRQMPALAGFKSPKPVVAADQQGEVVVLAYGMVDSPLGSDIVAWRSSDRGQSWESPRNWTNVAKAGEIEFDPWLESDHQGSFYSVHAARSSGGALFRKSHDGGQSWTEAIPLPWQHADRPVLGISPDGTKLVIAASMGERTASAPTTPLDPNAPDFREKLRAAIRSYPGVFVSSDQGHRWTRTESPFGDNIQAIPFAAVINDHDFIAVTWIVDGDGSTSAVSVSRNGGQTWHETTLVKPLQPDRSHPFNGERFPVIARDERGGLHVAYVSPTVPALEYRGSGDGITWGQPAPLSTANAEEVRMAAIDSIGPMVHVTWMERIGSTWHNWYRGSRDSGVTWSQPLCLSNTMSLSDGTTVNGFALYGDDDQSSIRDDGLGCTHAVWCIRGGHVLHAIIEWATPSTSTSTATTD